MKKWLITYEKFSFTKQEILDKGITEINGMPIDMIESDEIFLNATQAYSNNLISKETAELADNNYSRVELK